MDQNVITLLGSAQTSKQAWDILTKAYASKAKLALASCNARIVSLASTMLSIYYLQSIIALSNEFGVIKYPLDDIVIHTHNGLES